MGKACRGRGGGLSPEDASGSFEASFCMQHLTLAESDMQKSSHGMSGQAALHEMHHMCGPLGVVRLLCPFGHAMQAYCNAS